MGFSQYTKSQAPVSASWKAPDEGESSRIVLFDEPIFGQNDSGSERFLLAAWDYDSQRALTFTHGMKLYKVVEAAIEPLEDYREHVLEITRTGHKKKTEWFVSVGEKLSPAVAEVFKMTKQPDIKATAEAFDIKLH